MLAGPRRISEVLGALGRLCSLFSRFFSHFARLAAFVVALGLFLCVLGRSGLDFGGVRDAPGRVLEAPGLYFSRFLNAFACSRITVAWMLRTLQNTGRSGTKCTSEHVGHPARDAKSEKNTAPQLLEQGFLSRVRDNEVLERSRAGFGGVWASPGRLLGGSWAVLGRSWALLGVSWARLGRISGAFGLLWAANCCPGLVSGGVWEGFGRGLG